MHGVSFGPFSWLMVSDIFQLRTGGCGISLVVLANFGSNACVTFNLSQLDVLILGKFVHKDQVIQLVACKPGTS